MLLLRKIIAILLLGVFQLFITHQAFPHVHHSHPEDASTVTHKDHHHVQSDSKHHHHQSDSKHHHHHHDIPLNSQTGHGEGILGLLFGDHSHSDDIGHLSVQKTSIASKLKIKGVGSGLPTNYLDAGTRGISVAICVLYSPPLHPVHFFNPYYQHRGPPIFI